MLKTLITEYETNGILQSQENILKDKYIWENVNHP